jgi:endonuclease/exonuclease/phosphatase (EEP) superfamily protein YafD
LKTDEAHSPASAPKSANDTPKRPREWATAFVGFLAGLVGLALSRVGLIWPDFDVFSHFTVQFLIWTLCFAIVPWFFRRMASTASLAAVVCALTFYGLLPYMRDASPALDQSLDRPHLRLAVHNIYKSNFDFPRIAENLRKLQADVVILVEILPEHKDLFPLLLEEYPHQLSCHSSRRSCDIAIVSRYPIANPTWPISEIVEHIAHAVVSSPIGDIQLVGYHSSRFPLSRDQLENAKVLTTILGGLPRPMILAGDFNATPQSRTVNMIAANNQLTRLSSLPTWPARRFLPQLAIDHIMISDELEAVTSVDSGDPVGSDHMPLVVTIARKEKK